MLIHQTVILEEIGPIWEFPSPQDWMPRPERLEDQVYEIAEAADILALLTDIVSKRRQIWEGIRLIEHGMDTQDVECQYQGIAKIHDAATRMVMEDGRQGMRPLWRGLLYDIRVLVKDAQI